MKRNIRLLPIPDNEIDVNQLQKYVGRRAIIKNLGSGVYYNHGGSIGQVIIIREVSPYNNDGREIGIFDVTSIGGKKISHVMPQDVEIEPMTLTEYQILLDMLNNERKTLLEHMLYLRNSKAETYDSQAFIVWKLQQLKEKGQDLILLVLKLLNNNTKFLDFSI